MFTVARKGLEVAGKGIAGLIKGTPYPVQASAVVSSCGDGLTVSGSTYGTWARYCIDADRPVSCGASRVPCPLKWSTAGYR